MQRALMQEICIKYLRGDSLKRKAGVNNYLEFDQELVEKSVCYVYPNYS
jgi:hypothetical protein